MALTSTQVEKITLDLILGKPASITGPEADAFRVKLQKDLDFAKENGYTIELPFDPGSVA